MPMSMQHVLTPHVALAPIFMVIVCLTGPALSRVIERRGFVEVFEASVSDTGVGVGVGVGEDGGEDELHMFRAMRTVRDGADDVEKIEERGGTLGGIWIGGIADGESIFDAFHAHEAVRLVERPGAIEDDAIASALQIGLGVGIVPMALERHNVAVDVVEIDADVLHLANAHFRDRGGSSPRRGHDYVEDGLEWMMRNCRRRMQGMKGLFGSGDERRAGVPYDYIIHDVWNGDFFSDDDGDTPSSSSALYMLEAFENADCIMKSDGVFVLNYYGKREGHDFRAVLKTIRQVFAHTRVFHDAARDDAIVDNSIEASAAPYNMIVFASMGPIIFRDPIQADFLGSTSIRYDALHGLHLREISMDASDFEAVPVLQASDDGASKLWELQRGVRQSHAASLAAVHRDIKEEL